MFNSAPLPRGTADKSHTASSQSAVGDRAAPQRIELFVNLIGKHQHQIHRYLLIGRVVEQVSVTEFRPLAC